MTAIFNGKMKYLFLAPITVLIIFAILNQSALTRLNSELFDNKKNAAQAEIDHLANIVESLNEYDVNLSKDGYENILISEIKKINSNENVFAALYDQNLKPVSYGSAVSQYVSFDPAQFPQFNRDVINGQYGWLKNLSYTNANLQTMPLDVYYRQTPVNASGTERYIMVVGVSGESVTIPLNTWLTTGMILQLAVTFIMNMVFILFLCIRPGIPNTKAYVSPG